MSRIAILDLGTNTFNILITENDATGYKQIYRDKHAVRLGQGGIQKLLLLQRQNKELWIVFLISKKLYNKTMFVQ